MTPPVVSAFRDGNGVFTMVWADGRYARYVHDEYANQMVWFGYNGPDYAGLFPDAPHSAGRHSTAEMES